MTTGLLDKTKLTTLSETAPVKGAVDTNELASTQLDKMLNKDSPLRRTSETYGKNYATSRGLLDSSIGAQATFGAFVDRATPIATFDADRYGKVADRNLEFENQFKIADKNFGQQGLLQKDNQTFVSGESSADRAWRSGENAIDRIHQGSLLDKELSFTGTHKDLDRDVVKKEIESQERTAIAQSKADLEKLGISMDFDKYQLNASTQNQIQIMLLDEIRAIRGDGNLDPAAKEVAILNATDAANLRAKVVSDAMGTPIMPRVGSFDPERASQVMVEEATKQGFPNVSMAELNAALEYAQSGNLTEQQMRSYVRDSIAAMKSGGAPPAPAQQSQGSASALIDLAAQYGYSATAEEAAQVAQIAAQRGVSPEQVVMEELRARGLA
jgi:hypothetical protein